MEFINMAMQSINVIIHKNAKTSKINQKIRRKIKIIKIFSLRKRRKPQGPMKMMVEF